MLKLITEAGWYDIPQQLQGMILAKVYYMNITSTRLINYKVHSLNTAQLTILLNRERRKLLLARGHHSRIGEVAEIQHSIHELQRILQHKELEGYGRHSAQPVRS